MRRLSPPLTSRSINVLTLFDKGSNWITYRERVMTAVGSRTRLILEATSQGSC
jgi:hypothetical protein